MQHCNSLVKFPIVLCLLQAALKSWRYRILLSWGFIVLCSFNSSAFDMLYKTFTAPLNALRFVLGHGTWDPPTWGRLLQLWPKQGWGKQACHLLDLGNVLLHCINAPQYSTVFFNRTAWAFNTFLFPPEVPIWKPHHNSNLSNDSNFGLSGVLLVGPRGLS